MPESPQGATHADLLFAGTVYCDVVFSGVPVPNAGTEVFAEAFSITPGGVANRAVASARLGAHTILLSQLGDDVLGTHIREILREEPHLDVDHLALIAGHQSPVTVSLTGAHDRSFITYQEPTPAPALPSDLTSVGATHVGIAQELPPWVARLRSNGTTIVGGVGWDASGKWSHQVLQRLADVDIFVPNDLEAMRYTRTDDAVAAARALGEHVELAVVTQGPRGVIAYNSGTGQLTQVPAILVDAVDPTGAGDVFVASFMASLAYEWPIDQQLRFAGLCASLSVMSLGGAASAPRPAALATYLIEQRPAGDWTCIEEWAAAHSRAELKEKECTAK